MKPIAAAAHAGGRIVGTSREIEVKLWMLRAQRIHVRQQIRAAARRIADLVNRRFDVIHQGLRDRRTAERGGGGHDENQRGDGDFPARGARTVCGDTSATSPAVKDARINLALSFLATFYVSQYFGHFVARAIIGKADITKSR